MNMKNAWVKRVGTLAVVAALMWMPVAAKAAPVQGGEVEGGTWAPVDWLSDLGQVWDSVKAALGFGTAPEPPEISLQVPAGPKSNEMSTESVSADTGGDVVGAIDPNG